MLRSGNCCLRSILRHSSKRTSCASLTNLTRNKRFIATVSVTPNKALVDQNLEVSAVGLPPRHPVTLHAYIKEGKIRYTCCAHYVTDDVGVCDLSRDASVGGMYTGVEPMGLFWAMEAGPNEPWGRRLIKFDVTTPFKPEITVYDGHLDWIQCMEKFQSKKWLAHTSCSRSYLADDVKRVPVKFGRLRATMFIPAGSGPFPAVIDLFGHGGGLYEFRAALLAAHGILALSVAYFSYDDLPTELDRLDMNYFYEAIEYLNSQPFVKRDKGLGSVGSSLGGNIAAVMSTLFQEITCCVIINTGINLIITAPYYNGKWLSKTNMSFKEMLQKGTLLDNGTLDMVKMFKAVEVTDGYRKLIANSKARHLLIESGDDKCVPPESVDIIAKLLASGGNYNVEIVRLPGAGHLLEPPHSPLNPAMPSKYGTIASGGNKVDHARGQVIAWTRTIDYIKQCL